MELLYMGTSASEGIPAIFCECDYCKYARMKKGKECRVRAHALVDDMLLLDFGPEVYSQSIKFDVHLSKVKYLLLTHDHKDHLLASTLNFRGHWWAKDMYEDILNIYGGDACAELVNAQLESCVPEVRQHLSMTKISPFEKLSLSPYTVTALPAFHDQNQQCLIYLVEKEEKKLLYAHDTGNNIDEAIEFLSGTHIDTVSFDCTCSLRKTSADSPHMGLYDNINMRDKMLSKGIIDSTSQLICNHIAHGSATHEELSREAEKEGFLVAYDGLRVNV